MYNYIKKEGKDNGLPNWRIKIEIDQKTNDIVCSIENFDTGFSPGEYWDVIAKDNQYTFARVSIVTKQYKNIINNNLEESLKNELLVLLKQTHSKLDKEMKDIIKYNSKKMKNLEKFMNISIYRSQKIKKIIEAL